MIHEFQVFIRTDKNPAATRTLLSILLDDIGVAHDINHLGPIGAELGEELGEELRRKEGT